MRRLLILVSLLYCQFAQGQAWSPFLDPSRATTWAGNAGFTITNYTTACSGSPPSLATGSGNAAANTTAITNAIATCNSTHNVVNLPAGTYYINALTITASTPVVVRGAGSSAPGNSCSAGSTCLIENSSAACGGTGGDAGICVTSNPYYYSQSSQATYGSGSRQCLWTGGYTQGSTSITINSCGGTATSNGLVVGQMIVMDQANDLTDNGGIFLCDTWTWPESSDTQPCTVNDSTSGQNVDGRPVTISGKTYTMSQKQFALITSVSGSGTGPYTVGISPGVYFNNIHSGAQPGVWFPSFMTHIGLENFYVDGTAVSGGENITITGCYQCWIKGIASYNAGRAQVLLNNGMNNVVRDSYFFQSQSHSEESYTVEFEQTSADLVENNIMQQLTNPIMSGNTTGSVVDYNLAIGGVYVSPNYLQSSYSSHNAGNDMNLYEGNNLLNISTDDTWGSSNTETYFRNFLVAWQKQSSGPHYNTSPFIARAYSRVHNLIGNVMGMPAFGSTGAYHTNYQSYATSATGGVNQSLLSVSIYSLGWTGNTETTAGTCGTPQCDSVVFPTLMRWGNYDVVNAATQWNSTEASPAAVSYVNANFSTSYFNTLAQTLPTSLAYTSVPVVAGGTCGSGGTGFSWWCNPTTNTRPPFPPIGPDVTTGNVGICNGGTYSGALSTSASYCTGGGSLASAWASHAAAIPAEICYQAVMNGPPDGTGSMLGFNAAGCYEADTSSTYSITVTSPTNGSVVDSQSLINCPSTCSTSSATGTDTLTATPSGGYTYGSWGGGTCSGSDITPCSVSGAATVTASFVLAAVTAPSIPSFN
jgi:hypothetical protein